MKSMILAALMTVGFLALAVDMPGKDKVLNAAKAKATDVMAACKEDTVTYCKEIKGVDKIKACLKENVDKLTPACKDSVTKM